MLERAGKMTGEEWRSQILVLRSLVLKLLRISALDRVTRVLVVTSSFHLKLLSLCSMCSKRLCWRARHRARHRRDKTASYTGNNLVIISFVSSTLLENVVLLVIVAGECEVHAHSHR